MDFGRFADIVLACALAIPAARGDDLVIESFDSTGRLTFNAPADGTKYLKAVSSRDSSEPSRFPRRRSGAWPEKVWGTGFPRSSAAFPSYIRPSLLRPPRGRIQRRE